MEYIIPAVSAIVVDQLIEQEAYPPARVEYPNTYAGVRYTKLQVGLLMK